MEKIDLTKLTDEELLNLYNSKKKRIDKQASHLLRLLLECKELLMTGELQFPLSYKDTLLDIKTGKWKLKELLEYAEQLEKEIDIEYEKSELPYKPQFDKINDLCVNMVEEWFNL